MKNYKLLLATTAVLALGAFAANAEHVNVDSTLSTTIHSEVYIATTMQMEEASPLKFGMLLNPSSGDYVTVNADGTIDSKVAIGSYTESSGGATVGTVSAGSVVITDNSGKGFINLSPEGTLSYTFTLPNSIAMVDDHDLSCGTVTSLSGATASVDAVTNAGVLTYTFNYGGTYTIPDNTTFTALKTANGNNHIHCTGSGTITAVQLADFSE